MDKFDLKSTDGLIKIMINNLKSALNYDHINNATYTKLLEVGELVLQEKEIINEEDKKKFIQLFNAKACISYIKSDLYQDVKEEYEREIQEFYDYLVTSYDIKLNKPEKTNNNDKSIDLKEAVIPVHIQKNYFSPIENYDDELIDERVKDLSALLFSTNVFINDISKKRDNFKEDKKFYRMLECFLKIREYFDYLKVAMTRPSDQYRVLLNHIATVSSDFHDIVVKYDENTIEKISLLEPKINEINEYIINTIIDEAKKM